MIPPDFRSLPFLSHFKELKKGDPVYSRQLGLGEIESIYRVDEIIVRFSGLTKRLSIHDGVCLVPETYLQKQSNSKVVGIVYGKPMTLAELKKQNIAERKRLKLEQQILKEKQQRERKKSKVL